MWNPVHYEPSSPMMLRAPRLAVLFALVCALFVRALVPAGWMPAEGHGFAVELCPSAAAMPMADMGHQRGIAPNGHGSQHNDQHGECAFSPLQAGFAPADEVARVAGPISAPVAPLRSFAATVFTTGPPSPPPPSTGPPALA